MRRAPTFRHEAIRTLHLGGLLLAVIIVACNGGDGGTPGATAADASGDAPLARLIAHGTLVDSPYDVTVDGATVVVNGYRATSFDPPAPPEPEPVDEGEILDIFALVELARLTYLDAGEGNAGIDAAIQALSGRPEVAEATAEEIDGVRRVRVTSTDGLSASFIPDPPERSARDASDAERAEAAKATAAALREHLDAGGGLVVAESGDVITIPSTEVEAVLGATDAAMALDGDARRSALLEIYDDEAIVEEIIERYEPRTSASPTREARELRARRMAASPEVLPAEVWLQGSPDSAKTPASNKAWVFVTLYFTDANGFIDALVKEGYRVRTYNFYNVDQPAGSSWGAFLNTSQSGAVYFATHSSATGLSIEDFPRRADANTAAGRLRAQIAAGDLDWWQERNGTWWLKVTPQGIQKHWKSADTIVHSASCHSITLAGAFNAREFFGYQPTTSCAIATPDTNRLWRRLTGEDGAGSLREASAAFGAGGFSAGFRYRDGSPSDGTVLSPSVRETSPTEPVPVGADTFIAVRFDADMERNSPELVVSVDGCLQPIATGQWVVANFLTIPVRAESAGTAEVTVHHSFARSEKGKIHLDGNLAPEGTNGVATNRDNYVFNVTCVADATATPTTGVDPRTPTATEVAVPGGEIAEGIIRVNDPSSPVPEGYVRIEVLELDGQHYPAIQFTVALPDACDADHYHSGVVYSLQGGQRSDPNPPQCGHGRVSEVPLYSVDVAESILEALPFTP